MSKKVIPKLGYRSTRGIKDFFLMYPYKKNYKVKPGVVPRPYVPKDQVVEDHKFSLDSHQYYSIIKIFFEELVKYLMEGRTYTFSNRLGDLYIKKVKPTNSPISFSATIKKIKKLMGNEDASFKEVMAYKKEHNLPFSKADNRHTDNMLPKTVWNKTNKVYLGRCWKWEWSKIPKNYISNLLMEDPFKIHKLK